MPNIRIEHLNLPTIALSDRDMLPKEAALFFVLDSLGTVRHVGYTCRWLRYSWHQINAKSSDIANARIAYRTGIAPEDMPRLKRQIIERYDEASWIKEVN